MPLRLLAVLLLTAALPARARANGAFPDTGDVLLPAAAPALIVVGTNFGLVISEDDGATWRWTCEHGEGTGAARYQLAATPSPRVFAMNVGGLASTDDFGCSWGALDTAETIVFDHFPDSRRSPAHAGHRRPPRATPHHRGATGRPRAGSSTRRPRARRSPRSRSRGPTGASSTRPWRRPARPSRAASCAPTTAGAPGRSAIRSACSAATRCASRPSTPPTPRPSTSGSCIVTPTPSASRTTAGSRSRFGLSVPGQLTAFLRLHDGRLLAAAQVGMEGRLFRSEDRGASFAPLPGSLHVRALAERDGVVYAATDNAADGQALARSSDGGETWRPTMRFQDIARISGCGDLAAICGGTCLMLAAQRSLDGALCGVPASRPDAAPAGPAKPPGCGCALGGTTTGNGWGGAALAAVAVALRARARRRGGLRGRSGPPPSARARPGSSFPGSCSRAAGP